MTHWCRPVPEVSRQRGGGRTGRRDERSCPTAEDPTAAVHTRVAWLVLAAGGVQPFRRRLRLGLAWWSATGLMLDWHLGMFEMVDGRPGNLGAADALTLARAWLIPVALDTPTPIVCGLAAATDALDGRSPAAPGPRARGATSKGSSTRALQPPRCEAQCGTAGYRPRSLASSSCGWASGLGTSSWCISAPPDHPVASCCAPRDSRVLFVPVGSCLRGRPAVAPAERSSWPARPPRSRSGVAVAARGERAVRRGARPPRAPRTGPDRSDCRRRLNTGPPTPVES
jgi:hypothetical protein